MQAAPTLSPQAAWQEAMRKASAALRDGMTPQDAGDILRQTFFKLLGYEEPQEETES
jgi:hypothetical protein